MKPDNLSPIFLCGLMAGLCPVLPAARAADNASPAVPVFAAPPQAAAGKGQPVPAAGSTDAVKASQVPKAPRLSSGLDEIVRLSKAGVEEGVILAFIQNSPVAYRPSAQEILALRESGISSPILTAVLQHGAELRQRTAEAPPQPAAPAPAGANPPAVPEPTRVQPSTVYYGDPAAYSVTSPTVVYASSPGYSYGYGGYYYPRYSSCYSGVGFYGGFFPGISVGFGFGGRSGGHYGGHVSTVRGGFRGGFHGGRR